MGLAIRGGGGDVKSSRMKSVTPVFKKIVLGEEAVMFRDEFVNRGGLV